MMNKKGVAGLPVLLSVVSLLFMIGLVVFIFSVMGGSVITSAVITETEDLGEQGNASSSTPLNLTGGNITEGMIAFYKLNDSTGTSFADEIGTYDSTSGSGTACSSVTGRVEDAIGCSGSATTSDYVLLSHAGLTNVFGSSNWTIGGWFLMTDNSCGTGISPSGACTLIGMDEDAIGEYLHYIGMYNDGVTVVIGDAGPSGYNTQIPLSNGWHYITVTVGYGGNVGKVYVDGVLNYTTLGLTSNPTAGGIAPNHIGFFNTVSGNGFFGASKNVTIDEFVFYDRGLSGDDVHDLYVTTNANLTYANYGDNETGTPCTPTTGECGWDGCGVLLGTCDDGYVCQAGSCNMGSLAGAVILDTNTSLAGVTTWFPVIIVITAMVVLILLTVLIVRAVRGSGLVASA